MKTILAATDFSAASLNAVKYAAGMAMKIKADLLLLHVYNIPVNYNDGPPIVQMPTDELREECEMELEKLKQKIFLYTAGNLNIRTKTRMGNITEELTDLCKSLQPFVVVIGTRGKTNAEKKIFGSSAISIIHHLTSPVICIPPEKEFRTGISKLGFACDYKEVGETTPAQVIKDFRKEFKASLHILNVDHNDKPFSESGRPEETFMLHQLFYHEAPEYHLISNTDIEAGINEFVEKNKIDLLIIITRKHKLLNRLLHHSHSRQIVETAQVPVLCIHE